MHFLPENNEIYPDNSKMDSQLIYIKVFLRKYMKSLGFLAVEVGEAVFFFVLSLCGTKMESPSKQKLWSLHIPLSPRIE
jgi:hypothetical protein